MKVCSNEQINYLKSIVETEMFHMGRIEKFEQLSDNQFLLKVSENKCEYTCLVEYECELSSFVLVIKSVFGRTVLKRWLSMDVFPVQQVAENINNNYEEPSSVGERIKEVRKTLKLTQEQFVKEIGISRSHLSSIESGKENPSVILIKLISIKYNISEAWLNSGVGSPDTSKNDHVSTGVMLTHIMNMQKVLDEIKNILLSDNRKFNI